MPQKGVRILKATSTLPPPKLTTEQEIQQVSEAAKQRMLNATPAQRQAIEARWARMQRAKDQQQGK